MGGLNFQTSWFIVDYHLFRPKSTPTPLLRIRTVPNSGDTERLKSTITGQPNWQNHCRPSQQYRSLRWSLWKYSKTE